MHKLDLTIICRGGKQVQVNKVQLSAISTVFSSKVSINGVQCVNISEDVTALQVALKSLGIDAYYGQLELGEIPEPATGADLEMQILEDQPSKYKLTELRDLYLFGKKYEILSLHSMAVQGLKSLLSSCSLEVLKVAIEIKSTTLLLQSLKYLLHQGRDEEVLALNIKEPWKGRVVSSPFCAERNKGYQFQTPQTTYISSKRSIAFSDLYKLSTGQMWKQHFPAAKDSAKTFEYIGTVFHLLHSEPGLSSETIFEKAAMSAGFNGMSYTSVARFLRWISAEWSQRQKATEVALDAAFRNPRGLPEVD